jgi:osmotically-inducible protein OsmY
VAINTAGDKGSAELRDRVKQFLASQHYASFRKLEITTLGDRVVLQGSIPSFHERQLAVALCNHVPGVRHVVDQLVVPEPSPEERPRFASIRRVLGQPKAMASSKIE